MKLYMKKEEMYKKFISIVIIISLLFIASFSGCMDVDVPKDILQFSIAKFEVEPSIITQGETANLSWIVIGAKSVSIDNEIGNVSTSGSRIIIPTDTTIYTLTAKNATTTLTATTQIFVNQPTEHKKNATISMTIYSKDTSSGTIMWLVTGVENGPIEDDSLMVVLVKEDNTIDNTATITFHDNDYNNYVNPGDIFTVGASQDGYYTVKISDTISSNILYKSTLVHYEMIYSTLSMNIYSRDDANNLTIWLVSGIEGEAVEDGSYSLTLLYDNGTLALSGPAAGTFEKQEVTGAGYVNAGDTFYVQAPEDGYFVFMITDISSGHTIYKSTATKY